jgi:hypothetical protein
MCLHVLHRFFYVLCALTAHEPAHGHGGKVDVENSFLALTKAKRADTWMCAHYKPGSLIGWLILEVTKNRNHSANANQKAAGGAEGKKGKYRKGKMTKLTQGSSLTEDTPRDAAANALRLRLYNFLMRLSKLRIKQTNHHPG